MKRSDKYMAISATLGGAAAIFGPALVGGSMLNPIQVLCIIVVCMFLGWIAGGVVGMTDTPKNE